MRVNLSVIGRGQPLPAGEAIVSSIDFEGRITRVNPAVVRAFGFGAARMCRSRDIRRFVT